LTLWYSFQYYDGEWVDGPVFMNALISVRYML